MSLALIDDLAKAAAQLYQAMQASDLGAIEGATAGFREALGAVQAVGAWRSDPALKARVGDLVGTLEASRMLACLLGDMTGQMHAAIASRAPDIPPSTYQRPR